MKLPILSTVAGGILLTSTSLIAMQNTSINPLEDSVLPLNSQVTVLDGSESGQTTTNYVDGQLLIRLNNSGVMPAFAPSGIAEATTASNTLDGLLSKYKASEMIPIIENSSESISMMMVPASASDKSSVYEEALKNTYLINIDGNVEQAVAEFAALAEVEYAEPNMIVKVQMVPNDPYYGQGDALGFDYDNLWGHSYINASDAWDVSQGEGVVVAVVDTGLQLDHEDIVDNVWVNEAEIPDNGIDDDGNGYIDDYTGWDFANSDNDPSDFHGHGTHVSGTIAAVGNNNLGIIGIAPKAKIMPLKGLGDNGSGNIYNLAKALYYAADMGADVINNSWGGYGQSSVIEDAVAYAHAKGSVVVAAAGNDRMETTFVNPANAKYAITVGSIGWSYYGSGTINTGASNFSNFGADVDVYAPGYMTLSLLAEGSAMATSASYESARVDDNYLVISGTSMATPHVAGVAALLRAKDNSLQPEQIRSILRRTTSEVGYDGWDANFAYGVIDAAAALNDNGSAADISVEITSPNPFAFGDEHYISNSIFKVTGLVEGEDVQGYELSYAKIDNEQPGVFVSIVSGSGSLAESEIAIFDATGLEDGEYVLRLTAWDSAGNEIEANRTVLKYGDLLPGWPKQSEYTGVMPNAYSFQSVQPKNNLSFADLDNDGQDEVIAIFKNEMTIWNQNGELLEGWPKNLAIAGQYTNSSFTSYGDIDGDGDLEIIFVANNQYYRTSADENRKAVYAYHHNGELVSGFPAGVIPFYDEASNLIWPESQSKAIPVMASGAPVLFDFDNDGADEIAVTFGAGHQYGLPVEFVYLLDGDGTEKTGWPIVPNKISGFGNGVLSPCDIDGDGQFEIAHLFNEYDESTFLTTYVLNVYDQQGNVIATHRHERNGTIQPGEEGRSGTYLYGTMRIGVADADNDGKDEIAALFTTTTLDGTLTNNSVIKVFGESTGNDLAVESEFSVEANNGYGNPTFIQYNSTPELEIVTVDYSKFKQYVYDLDGQTIQVNGSNYGDVIINNASELDIFAYSDFSDTDGINLISGVIDGWYTSDLAYNRPWFGIGVTNLQSGFDSSKARKIGAMFSPVVMSDTDVNRNMLYGGHVRNGNVYVFKATKSDDLPANNFDIFGDAGRTGKYRTTNVSGPACEEYTGSIQSHVDAGRAYVEQSCPYGPWYCINEYYATGSGETLGSTATTNVTLIEDPVGSGNYKKGTCGTVDPSAPVISNVTTISNLLSATVKGNVVDVDGDLVRVEVEFDDSGEWIKANGYENWSLSLNDLTPGSSHSARIRAMDSRGEYSAITGPISLTTADLPDPYITDISGRMTGPNIYISALANDEVNQIIGAECRINGGDWVSIETTSHFNCNYTKLANPADYTVELRVLASYGRISEIETLEFSIEQQSAPTCTMGEVTHDDGYGSYGFMGTFSDVDGDPAKAEFRVDGGDWINAFGMGNTWAGNFDGSDLVVGTHTVEGRIIDSGDLIGNCGTVEFQAIPHSAPIIKAVYIVDSATEQLLVVSTWDNDGDTRKVEYQLDNSGEWLVLADYDYNLTGDRQHTKPLGLPDGAHTVKARSYDSEGNVSDVIESSIDIGNPQAPVCQIISVTEQDNGYYYAQVEVSDANNDLDKLSYKLDAAAEWTNSWLGGMSPYAIYLGNADNIGVGTHTVEVNVIDTYELANNCGPFTFEVTPPPSAPIIEGIMVSPGVETVTVSGTAADADGDIDTVKIEFDYDSDLIMAEGKESFTLTRSMVPGDHVVRVFVEDSTGLCTISEDLEFTVLAPTNPPVIDSLVATGGTESGVISGTASDADGDLAKVEIELDDNGNWITVSGTSTWNYTASGLTAGTHTVKARATDSEGTISPVFGPVSFDVEESTCQAYTSTLTEHETAGRAWSETTTEGQTCIGTFCWGGTDVTTWYATGSDEELGTNGSATVTLKEEVAGVFTQGDCPAEPQAPVIESYQISELINAKAVVTGVVSDADGDVDRVVLGLGALTGIICEGTTNFTCTLDYSVHDITVGSPLGVTLVAYDSREVASNIEQFTITRPEPQPEEAPVIANLQYSVSGSDLTVTADVTDANGNLDYVVLVRVDDIGGGDCTNAGGNQYTCTLTGLEPGTYQFKVDAQDLAENLTSSDIFTVEVEDAGSCFTAANSEHAANGRAELKYNILYYAIGSGDYLGQAADVTSLEEQTQPGNWVKVTSCD